MAFMQHYMQMASGQMDPAMLQLMQYQMAASQGLAFPGFPGFPPPGMAEQVMAAYAAQAAASFPPACFQQFPPSNQPQDPVALAQQQAATAAAALAFYAQQQQQQQPHAQQQPQAQQQTPAHHAAGQSASAPSAAVPEQAAHALAQATASYPGIGPAHQQATAIVTQQPDLDRESHHQALPQNGRSAQQHTAMPAESAHAHKQQGIALLPKRTVVKDDPAFGNGRLYRPQASHAKASVAPPSTKFGGAMNDSFQCASALSRNSSSESILPPASCCFEAAGNR